MSANLNIIYLNESNNIYGGATIVKPKSYDKLIQKLQKLYPNFNEQYVLLIIENGQEIIVDGDKQYSLIKNKIYLRKLGENNSQKSMYEVNYEKLSESNKSIIALYALYQ